MNQTQTDLANLLENEEFFLNLIYRAKTPVELEDIYLNVILPRIQESLDINLSTNKNLYGENDPRLTNLHLLATELLQHRLTPYWIMESLVLTHEFPFFQGHTYYLNNRLIPEAMKDYLRLSHAYRWQLKESQTNLTARKLQQDPYIQTLLAELRGRL